MLAQNANRASGEAIRIALAYRRAGFSVIPIKARGKAPLVRQWQRFSAALPSEEEIQSWWHQFPAANLGCVCGPAPNLVVLDVDGPDGESSLERRDIPDTPRACTGEGSHYYFTFPHRAPLRNYTKFLPGLDLRATGGQVVAPPSRHVNGRRYQWEVMPVNLALSLADIGIYWTAATAPLAPPPAWLIEVLMHHEAA